VVRYIQGSFDYLLAGTDVRLDHYFYRGYIPSLFIQRQVNIHRRFHIVWHRNYSLSSSLHFDQQWQVEVLSDHVVG